MKIVVTGGAGFIGSCLVKELNKNGRKDIIIVDNLGTSESWKNLVNLEYSDFISKNDFITQLEENKLKDIELILHIGACSSTTEKDAAYLMENNFRYSKRIFDFCAKNNCRLVYASSAATYGDGTLGYEDNLLHELKPLNMYGYSKKIFDQYVLTTKDKPVQYVGLKFFNVYGPNEYHKGDMASVVFKGFNEITATGLLKLFKSYKEGVKDGEQKRDFIYIKDVVAVVLFMMDNKNVNGIFNVGTGKARTFYDLGKATFEALHKRGMIEFKEMPESLKEKYQYYTEANMKKLRSVGYTKEFFSLEDGVKDYVINYLSKNLKHYD